MGNISPAGRGTRSQSVSRAPLEPNYTMQRGALLNPDDNLDGIEFGFMPTFSGGKGINWVKIDVPGLSDPIFQYRSGDTENFALTLRSDDRDRRPCPEDPTLTYNKPESDLNWLRSKMASQQEDNRVVAVPPVLLLVLGTKSDTVRINKLGYRFIQSYPNGRPKVMEITLDLFYVIDAHRQPDDFLLRF